MASLASLERDMDIRTLANAEIARRCLRILVLLLCGAAVALTVQGCDDDATGKRMELCQQLGKTVVERVGVEDQRAVKYICANLHQFSQVELLQTLLEQARANLTLGVTGSFDVAKSRLVEKVLDVSAADLPKGARAEAQELLLRHYSGSDVFDKFTVLDDAERLRTAVIDALQQPLVEKFTWQPQLLACQLVDSDCLITALLQRTPSRSRFLVTLFFGMLMEFCVPKAIQGYCFQGVASTLLCIGVAEVLLCIICTYFYSTKTRAGQLAKGDEVQVIEDFQTNEEHFAQLHAGETGIVDSLDRDGDAMVRFPDHARLHCIFKKDFDKLHKLGKAGAIAALPTTASACGSGAMGTDAGQHDVWRRVGSM